MRKHYDEVTQAWRYMMGESAHYGFFETGKEPLERATLEMLEEMLALVSLRPDTHLLDVGCGQGGPAFYLHKKFGIQITGVSLSALEVEIARKKSNKGGLQNDIRFLEMDITQNNFEDNSFDIVFIVETALLVPDKNKLFSECFRVLKKGGELVLCDPFKLKTMSPADIYKNGKALEKLHSTFGETKTETMDYYQQLLSANGFKNISQKDITQQAKPTPLHWKQNCLDNREKMLETISTEKFDGFIIACDTLTRFLDDEFIRYGIMSAKKA